MQFADVACALKAQTAILANRTGLREPQALQDFIYDIQGYLPGRTGLPGVGKGHGRAEGFAAQAAHGTQRSHAHGDDGRFGVALCHLGGGSQQLEDVRGGAGHHGQLGQVGSGLLHGGQAGDHLCSGRRLVEIVAGADHCCACSVCLFDEG